MNGRKATVISITRSVKYRSPVPSVESENLPTGQLVRRDRSREPHPPYAPYGLIEVAGIGIAVGAVVAVSVVGFVVKESIEWFRGRRGPFPSLASKVRDDRRIGLGVSRLNRGTSKPLFHSFDPDGCDECREAEDCCL